MRRSALVGAVVLAAVAAASTPAAAQGAISVRFRPDVSDEAIALVARAGVATQAAVAAGDDVAALALAKCGHVREAYVRLLGAAPGDPRIGPDRRAAEPGTLALPACGRYQLEVEVTPSLDVNVSRLLRRETGYEGEVTRNDFYRLNPQLRRAEVVRAGQRVVLPYRSELTTIFLRSGVAPFATQEELSRLLGRGPNAPPSKVATLGALVASEPRARLLAASTCKPTPASGAPWPFDGQRVVQALDRSVTLSSRTGRLRGARIAILDTGLMAPPTPPFAWSRLATNTDAQGVVQFGVDAAARQGSPITPPGIKDADHGTGVAVIALGGGDFLAADRNGLSAIKLRVARIAHASAADATAYGAPITEEAVSYGLRDALANDAVIVNASFQFASDLELLRDVLRTNARLLMVVAAGNDPPETRDLDDAPRWPANYGGDRGDYRDQVITVGASDAEGKPADFTAYSPYYVDLLAPGCGIPTLKLDGSPTAANGTSFAAPLVSFGAALLQQLGLSSPKAIKERLLVSADVRSDLLPLAWSAGILNLEKALDIYADQTWVAGRAEPIRSDVYFDFLEPPRCTISGVRVPSERIRRLARLDDQGQWLVVWRTQAGRLDKCLTNLPPDHAVAFASDGGETDMPLRDIDDVVLKEFSAG